VGLIPLKEHRLGPFRKGNAEFRRRWCILPVCALFFCACGAQPAIPKALKLPGLPKHVNEKFTMQINVSDNANQNEPIPMDFVMVLDKKTIQEVAKLTSKDWFERRVQVERDHPGKIVVASWEWAPGEHVGPISVDVSPDFKAGFLFASYVNASDHRAVINALNPIVVNLRAEDFSVMSLK
jgi:hypothetical protein